MASCLSFCALILGLTAMMSCRDENQPSPETAAVWDAFLEQFLESYFRAHPTFAVAQGRHEYDGELPDWSEPGLASEIDRLHAQRRRAETVAPSRLDARRRFEREYLLWRIDHDLFWIEKTDAPHRSPSFYLDGLPDALDPNVYIARPYAPLRQRMRAFTIYAQNLPRAAGQIRSNLKTPLSLPLLEYGLAAFEGLAAYFETDVRQAFSEVNDGEFREEFDSAVSGASRSMRELAAWLSERKSQATADFALGPERFHEMLIDTERVDAPLERLREIGERDLERNLAQLSEACRTYAPDLLLGDCVSKVQADKPEGGPVEGARAQLADLRQFLIDRDLVSIPGKEEARVEEAPPYNRQNSAYIDIPGPYDKNLPSIYYIAPPDPQWSVADQRAFLPGKADLLFTSVHEVWPGHFLNSLHSNRSEYRLGRVFYSYAFSEGWAHYTEELMWESGLGKGDPEVHIGQLLNALLRNVRFLSAIGLHTQGMTIEESERMFREKAFQDPGNARQQAARGTYDPAYLNYTLGKLMIRRLREDWTSTRGGRSAWHQFHDQLLSYGGPPLPLARSQMLNGPIESAF